MIDEMAVFNRTLSPEEIEQLWWSGFRMPEVTLAVRRSGESLVITWPQGTLFEADDPGGPWRIVLEAVSPYVIRPDAAKKFYRVLVL
jgi:hypothetical protein